MMRSLIFSIYLILLGALGPGVYTEMSARNRKTKMFMGSRAQSPRNADNIAAICEPIV
jgi:hypothetical protein